MDHTIVVAAAASVSPRRCSTSRPTPACAMAEYFQFNGADGQAGGQGQSGTGGAVHLRRPLQARRGLSRDLAAAPAPAGTRGLPGRRLLPALAPAGARQQAERAAGRGIDHRASDHRDAGRGHLRLHPDQRDLDHRRADLPGIRPVLLRHPPRRERRAVRVARGRQRADQGHEADRGDAAPLPGPVPGAGGVRAVRLRPGQGHAGAAQPRPPPRRRS